MSKINETNYPRRTQANYADTDMLIIQAAGGNTYTTRIEDLRDDYQETMAPTVGAINDALAPPENGSTASQAYAIGEHFMRDGAFCTAIAAIASGASFTLNTNYVVGTIAEALESLSSDITNKISTETVTLSFSNGGASLNRSDYPGVAFIVPTIAANSSVMGFLRTMDSSKWYFSGINYNGGYANGDYTFLVFKIMA